MMLWIGTSDVNDGAIREWGSEFAPFESLIVARLLYILLDDIPSSYTLGQHFEAFIQAQLASGRYNNASEVVRDALRLMEERVRRLAAVDAAIERGVADVKAGRVHDADAVLDELEARYAGMARERGEM